MGLRHNLGLSIVKAENYGCNATLTRFVSDDNVASRMKRLLTRVINNFIGF